MIRLPIPQLTEERRKELVKVVRHIAEEGRDRRAQRPPRRHAPPQGARRERATSAPTRSTAPRSASQKLTDEHVHKIDELLSARKPRSWRSEPAWPHLPHAAEPITRIRSLRTLKPLREPELPERRALGRDHHGRQRPLGAAPRPARRRRPPRRHAGAAAHGRGGDRPRHRVARRLRVLDRELVAPARRDRRADGDLRRDDRPRVARPRPAGRPRAVHRPARPCARRSCSGGWPRSSDETAENDRLEPLDRVRLRRPRPRSSRPRGGSSTSGVDPRRDRRERLRRAPLRARAARPGSPDPHLGRAARSRTSCSGRSRTRSSSSSTGSGPTSAATELREALAAYAQPPSPLRRPMTLSLLVAHRSSPLVGLPLVLGLVWLGGWWLFVLVAVGGAAGAARVLRDDAAAAADRARGLRGRCARRCSPRRWAGSPG